MNFTARNSTGVINLANKLIKEGLKISSSSFLEIKTEPVIGKNIDNPNTYAFKIFENYMKVWQQVLSDKYKETSETEERKQISAEIAKIIAKLKSGVID